jgi:hypothetical protein
MVAPGENVEGVLGLRALHQGDQGTGEQQRGGAFALAAEPMGKLHGPLLSGRFSEGRGDARRALSAVLRHGELACLKKMNELQI